MLRRIRARRISGGKLRRRRKIRNQSKVWSNHLGASRMRVS